MRSGILSFGSYQFPAALGEYSSNFGDAVPKTVRLPGLDGGYSDDGDQAAQGEIGNVRMGFHLIAETREAMDAKRDAVKAMKQWGVQKLVMQPTDPRLPARFCWARVNNITMGENKDKHSDLWQKVAMFFQVPDPKWLVPTYMPPMLDGQWNLGDSLEVGQGAYTFTASGVSTSKTVVQRGNADSIAIISILPGVGDSCENPTVQRVVNGAILDEWKYTGVVAAEEELIVDGQNQRAVLQAESVLGANFRYLTPHFLALGPGLNDLNVLFKNAGDEAVVRVWFYDVYR